MKDSIHGKAVEDRIGRNRHVKPVVLKRFVIPALALLCSFFSASAQQAKIDSLQNRLSKSKADSEKIELLNELAKNYLLTATLDTSKAKATLAKLEGLSLVSGSKRGKALLMIQYSGLERWRKNKPAAMKIIEECIAYCNANTLRREEAEAINTKGYYLQRDKKYDESLSLFQSAYELALLIPDTTQVMSSSKGLGLSYFYLSSYDSAIQYYSVLKDLALWTGASVSIGHSCSMLGIMYSMRGDYKQAIAMNQLAIPQYEQLGMKDQVANILNNSANSYRYLGRYEEALQHYYKAIALREALGDSSQLASPVFNAADILMKIDQKKKAIEYYRRSLAISQRMDDKNMQAISYGGIADWFRSEKQLDSTLAYHLHALELFEETRDKTSASQSMISVGNVYLDQARYDEALAYFTRAKPLTESAGLKKNLADLYGSMGKLHSVQDHLPEAEENFLNALAISEEIGYMEGKEAYGWHLCWLYKRLGNYPKAFEYATLASIANDSLVNRDRIQSMQELTEKYESEKKAEQIKVLEKQQQIDRYDIELKREKIRKQELADRDKSQRLELTLKDVEVKGLQVRQQNLEIEKQREENQKKKSELALLQKESELQQANLQQAALVQRFAIAGILALILFGGISYIRYRQRKRLSEKLAVSLTELKQMQEQLIETERQREQENLRFHISRDLHDDIGSTLSSINMLSRSAKKRMEEKDEAKLVESLEKIGERTQDTLDTMSDIIWSIKPGNDSLHYVLSHMREYAGTVLEAKKIDYTIDFPPEDTQVHLPLNLKSNLYLIFKEAVNNLAKYSHCSRAKIELKIRGDAISMTVEDNGVGFSVADGSKGNGLQNMRRRAEESEAGLTITSDKDKGTRVEFIKNGPAVSPPNMG